MTQTLSIHQTQRLLTAEQLREWGLGRHLAQAVIPRMPHVRAGNKRMVLSTDLEELLEEAAKRRLDLWELVKLEPERDLLELVRSLPLEANVR